MYWFDYATSIQPLCLTPSHLEVGLPSAKSNGDIVGPHVSVDRVLSLEISNAIGDGRGRFGSLASILCLQFCAELSIPSIVVPTKVCLDRQD